LNIRLVNGYSKMSSLPSLSHPSNISHPNSVLTMSTQDLPATREALQQEGRRILYSDEINNALQNEYNLLNDKTTRAINVTEDAIKRLLESVALLSHMRIGEDEEESHSLAVTNHLVDAMKYLYLALDRDNCARAKRREMSDAAKSICNKNESKWKEMQSELDQLRKRLTIYFDQRLVTLARSRE